MTDVERAVLEAVARDEAGEPAAAARALEDALWRWPRSTGTGGRSWSSGAGWRSCCAARSAPAPRTARSSASCSTRSPTARRCRATSTPLLEPLSEREQAILRYLPTALSNREIAAELFVTTNTVKTHLRSIYRKLDVARRREAVERARDLRLLSPGLAAAPDALQREAEQPERQRQPVREQPVGERREHGVAGAHAGQRQHRGQPGLDEPRARRA